MKKLSPNQIYYRRVGVFFLLTGAILNFIFISADSSILLRFYGTSSLGLGVGFYVGGGRSR